MLCLQAFSFTSSPKGIHKAKIQTFQLINTKVFLNEPFPASFLFSFFFSIQLKVNKCSINFANDWIRTVDLWYWKQPLNQLSHNHCPTNAKLNWILVAVGFKTSSNLKFVLFLCWGMIMIVVQLICSCYKVGLFVMWWWGGVFAKGVHFYSKMQ